MGVTVHRESRDKQIRLDIQLHADQLALKGVGVDVEPALLSGNVVLYLTEATSFKEINLQFKGKARLPVNPTDPYVLSLPLSNYFVFTALSDVICLFLRKVISWATRLLFMSSAATNGPSSKAARSTVTL